MAKTTGDVNGGGARGARTLVRWPLQRLAFGVAGAVVGAALVAWVEGRGAAEQGGVSWFTVALADASLVVPIAVLVGLAVTCFGIFVEPGGALSPGEHLARVRSMDVLPRSRLAAALPLAVLATLASVTAIATLARRLLADGAPAAAGVLLGLGTVGIVVLAVGATLALVGPVRRLLVMAAEERPRLLDPSFTFVGTLALAATLFGLGCAAGDAGGDGPTPLAIFGVLRRSELDLRPVVDLLAIALSAHLVPVAFAQRPKIGLRALVAVLVVGAGLAGLVRAAKTLNDEPKLTRAIEAHAPFGKLALGVLRKATDRDHDGASPWFGGGDCNDHDKSISPLAIDVPGDHVDQDCDGADLPLPPPKVVPPPPKVQAAFPANLNVVLITIDTLRLDAGFAGYDKPTTPNLDRLAERSTVFERAYSLASYTGKSVGPLLIGKYPSETLRDGGHFNKYAPDNVFVAERLKAAGVKTFGAASHWYFAPWSGLTQGIDEWDLSAKPQDGQGDNDTSITSAQLSDAAIRMLKKMVPKADGDAGASDEKPARFFMWLHYVDPHAQYMPHDGAPDFLGDGRGGVAASRAAYDGEVWFTDKHLGRVLDVLTQPPFAGTTAIIVTSDHGEAFAEHGMSWHGIEIWEPLVRVPLLIYVPEVAPHRVPVKRSAVDLVPTVLDLYGVKAAEGELSGVSMAGDVLDDHGPWPERDVWIDMPVGPYTLMRKALITGDGPGTKLIWSGGKNYQLFDLGTDPEEAHDLAADEARFQPVFGAFQAQRARVKEIDVPADAP
jgi:arylsulfatase A-like enzyme